MQKNLFNLVMTIRKKCLQTEEKIRSQLGLTLGEFNGLLLIKPGEKVHGLEFSNRMGLSQSRGSRVIARMMGSGFVNLETVQGDRRSAEASLTSNGKAMRKKIIDQLDDCEKRMTSQLSEAEIQKIKNTLERLISVM